MHPGAFRPGTIPPMSDAPPPRRRWFRFGMRTLLAALTVAAVASWLYWDGWTRWQLYLEQMQFEAAVQSMPAGMTIREADSALQAMRSRREALYGQRNKWGYLVYEWPDSVYVFYVPTPDTPHAAHTSFELFRLPAFPRQYTAKTAFAKSAVNWMKSNQEDPARLVKGAYWSDFFDMIRGDRRDKLGFEYELIYAAPPASE